MSRVLIIGTGTAGREVVSQLTASGVRVRALVRNPEAARLPPNVEVMRGNLTVPAGLDGCLDGVDTVPGVVRAAGRSCSRFGADREARAAHRMPLRSAQDITSLLPAAEPVQSAGGGNRAADRELRTRLDVSKAGNVRGKRPPLVEAADSGRRSRALALCVRSYGADSRT